MTDTLRLHADYLHAFRNGLLQALWPSVCDDIRNECQHTEAEYAVVRLEEGFEIEVEEYVEDVPDRVFEQVGVCSDPPIHVVLDCEPAADGEWDEAAIPTVKQLRSSVIEGLHRFTDLDEAVIALGDEDVLKTYQWLSHITEVDSLDLVESVETFDKDTDTDADVGDDATHEL